MSAFDKTLQQLRDEGYAVVAFNPQELAGTSPERLEDRLVELGWDVIDDLCTETYTEFPNVAGTESIYVHTKDDTDAHEAVNQFETETGIAFNLVHYNVQPWQATADETLLYHWPEDKDRLFAKFKEWHE